VKYFNNEDFEARRYDDRCSRGRGRRSQPDLAVLAQHRPGRIIAVGVTLMMWRAAVGVAKAA
jgi:ABC-type transport system involved in Fe-S cluster assembly fused permease/ATPase subunit